MAYSGLIASVVFGETGLYSGKNLERASRSALLEANNLTFADKTLQKEGGAAAYNSSAISGAPIIYGGFDWHPTPSVQRSIIATSDGKLLRDTGGGTYGTTLKTGLTINGPVVMVEGGAEVAANDKKLFIFTGNDTVQVLDADGTSTGAITNGAADWGTTNQPKAAVKHRNRHWAFGNANDRHRAYFTKADDHEDYVNGDAGSISVYPGEGDGIVGGIELNDRLWLFKKPRGIYWINTSSTTVSEWETKKLTDAVGAMSFYGILLTDTDVLFQSATGNWHLLSFAVQHAAEARQSSLTQELEFDSFIKDNLNLDRLDQVVGVYYGNAREAHFGVPAGSTGNNKRIVFDFNGQVPKIRVSDRDVAHSIWLRRDDDEVERPMIGDDVGKVWKLDQAARTKDGGYEGNFTTIPLDFAWMDERLRDSEKLFDHLEVFYLEGNGDLTISYSIDGKAMETLTYSMDPISIGGSMALGSWILGTDTLGGNVDESSRLKRLRGQGKRLTLEGSNSGDEENFSISRINIYFRPVPAIREAA